MAKNIIENTRSAVMHTSDSTMKVNFAQEDRPISFMEWSWRECVLACYIIKKCKGSLSGVNNERYSPPAILMDTSLLSAEQLATISCAPARYAGKQKLRGVIRIGVDINAGFAWENI